MARKCRFASFLFAFFGSLFITDCICAQVELPQPSRQLITQSIDESKRVTLAGNTRPEANATNDRGAVGGDFPMEHMQLQLRLPVEKEQQLEQYIQELHDPTSPNFHHWLTPEHFREEFSLTQEDINTITTWLESNGFTVNVIYPRSIDFSGTAVQVKTAFKTEIHNLDVNSVKHIGNANDPQIPAALAPAIVGIVSLNDFMPHPSNRPRANYTLGNGDYLVVPADLAAIYNFNPLFAKSVSGQGQTIVVIEDTDLYTAADWTTFRSTLGLSGYTSGSFTTVHPAPATGTNNCSDPGVNGDDAEAILDAEWASAGAPSAAIVLASCTNTTTFGGFIALQNLLNESGTPPAIVSISYGDSEPNLGGSGNAFISALYQQAVTEGVSVFVSSGDEGAASSDYNATHATHGITVSGFTSTPYNVSVGGTDFGDSYTGTNGAYWSSTNNTSTYGSALSYIPEIPWNDSCAGAILASHFGYATTYGRNGFCNSSTGNNYLTTTAGSGGPSSCATGTATTSGVVSGSCAGYPKPTWQSVVGNPSDGVRDIPDISLFAANGLWGHYYVACYSDPGNGGTSCAGAPNTWSGFGGTSISSPVMAAIQALVNQTTGISAGNPNSTYYSLARGEYGSGGNPSCNSSLGNGVSSACAFYDVTAGDMDVNCTGTHNCYLPSGSHGVLSKSNSAYQPAYSTNTGWDFATGIGTVNAYNLVTGWPKSSNPPVLTITKTHTGNLTQGQQNATYTVTVSNGVSAGATSGTVTVTETAPSGLTLVSITGTGWTCATNTCTRSDVLNGGASYPAITVKVNVASNASSPQVNQVNVSGGGSTTASASDSTVIIGIPVLNIAKTHTGSFTQGQQSAIYSVTVSNGVSAGPTSGTVTVTETAPSGLTLVSMAGTGWTCGATTCTRSDVLTGGSRYPSISVKVNVASNASSPQVNQVSVSGGGSAPANTSDSTTVQGSSTWSNGYTNMRAITISHLKVVNTDQTNFPVLISLPANTYADLKTTGNGGSVTNANGYDILFTSDAAGTLPLAYERESYNGATGAMIDWVKVATLSHTTDTVIYLFYGNAAVTTDQSNTSGTWDSNYVAVYHLPNGATLSANDSTSNANGGTITGATATTGEIDGGANFNGTGAEITTPYKQNVVTAYSIEAWARTSSSSVSVIVQDREAGSGHSLTLGLDGAGACGGSSCGSISGLASPAGKVMFGDDSNATFIGVEGTTALNDNNWHHIVGTWTASSGASIAASQFTVYVDGTKVSSPGTISAGSDSSPLSGLGGTVIGYHQAWNEYYDGLLDEVRISTTVRSADWVATEYNNQSSPATFYSVGAAATGGGSSTPTISSLSPTSGAVGASVTITGSNFGSSRGTSAEQFKGGFTSSVH